MGTLRQTARAQSDSVTQLCSFSRTPNPSKARTGPQILLSSPKALNSKNNIIAWPASFISTLMFGLFPSTFSSFL